MPSETQNWLFYVQYAVLAYFNSDCLLIPHRGLNSGDRDRCLNDRVYDCVLLLQRAEGCLSHSNRYHGDELLCSRPGVRYRQNLESDDRGGDNLY